MYSTAQANWASVKYGSYSTRNDFKTNILFKKKTNNKIKQNKKKTTLKSEQQQQKQKKQNKKTKTKHELIEAP